jgi:hypothetical protein
MPTMTDAQRDQIDKMSHLEMCRAWRFGRHNDPLITGIAGDYLCRRIQAGGGFTPDISRQIGWDWPDASPELPNPKHRDAGIAKLLTGCGSPAAGGVFCDLYRPPWRRDRGRAQ